MAVDKTLAEVVALCQGGVTYDQLVETIKAEEEDKKSGIVPDPRFKQKLFKAPSLLASNNYVAVEGAPPDSKYVATEEQAAAAAVEDTLCRYRIRDL